MESFLKFVGLELTLIMASTAAFVMGWVLARLIYGRKGLAGRAEDPRNHRIRELEIENRLLQKNLDESSLALDEKIEVLDSNEQTVRDLSAQLEAHMEAAKQAKLDAKLAVAKTRELRKALQDRAAEGVREHLRAEEACTELEVARAGSDAMLSEYEMSQSESSDDEEVHSAPAVDIKASAKVSDTMEELVPVDAVLDDSTQT